MNVKIILWVVASVVLIGFGFHYRGLHAEISAQKAEIDTLQDTVIDFENALNECNANKAKSERILSDHAKRISSLNSQLDDYRMLRDPKSARCIPITR